MTKICSNCVRGHTTSLWEHYVAQISSEVDRHLAVHDLGRTTWSHNIKCRTTHIAHTITTTRFISHNHVVPSCTTKFLSVWTHLKADYIRLARTLQNTFVTQKYVRCTFVTQKYVRCAFVTQKYVRCAFVTQTYVRYEACVEVSHVTFQNRFLVFCFCVV